MSKDGTIDSVKMGDQRAGESTCQLNWPRLRKDVIRPVLTKNTTSFSVELHLLLLLVRKGFQTDRRKRNWRRGFHSAVNFCSLIAPSSGFCRPCPKAIK
jgi:hypothetical protein